jgi:hypothetical protein
MQLGADLALAWSHPATTSATRSHHGTIVHREREWAKWSEITLSPAPGARVVTYRCARARNQGAATLQQVPMKLDHVCRVGKGARAPVVRVTCKLDCAFAHPTIHFERNAL